MKTEKEKIEAGDKVKFTAPKELVTVDGKTYKVDITKSYEVIAPFTDFDGIEACLLKMDGFDQPFMCNDITVVEKASENPDSEDVRKLEDEAMAFRALKAAVDAIPPYSLGYVFKINDQIVAAHSLEEAIGIYRKECTTTIKSVYLECESSAYIQNEIPVI